MNFGPNSCLYSEDMKIVGSSHRSDFAKNQYKLLQKNMRTRIPGLKDFDIIFVFGSSSLAMEIIISSLKNKIELTSTEGKFEQRWDKLISLYPKYGYSEIYSLGVQYETSLNKLNDVVNCDIIDAVCSFPLFNIPVKAKIIVGCANKMLGLGMGLSFIFIRKNSNIVFKENSDTYLSMNSLIRYSEDAQYPYTFPIDILYRFNHSILLFEYDDLKTRIRTVNELFKNSILSEFIISDHFDLSPTILLDRRVKDIIGMEFGYEVPKGIQVFTYSHELSDYELLLKDWYAV